MVDFPWVRTSKRVSHSWLTWFSCAAYFELVGAVAQVYVGAISGTNCRPHSQRLENCGGIYDLLNRSAYDDDESSQKDLGESKLITYMGGWTISRKNLAENIAVKSWKKDRIDSSPQPDPSKHSSKTTPRPRTLKQERTLTCKVAPRCCLCTKCQ